MASDEQPDAVNNEDDQFEAHFAEFAAAKAAPFPEAALNTDQSEGNDPKEPAAAAPEAAVEAPESVTSDSTAAAPEAAPEVVAPDLWASASPELVAERDRLQAELDRALHQARSDASRVAALSRKLAVGGTPTPAPEPAEPTQAQKDLDEKIKQLREDFPEVAAPLADLIDAQRAELGTLKEQVSVVHQDRRAAQEAAELQALEAVHPDFRLIASDPQWGEWLGQQAAGVQRLANSWDHRETSVALTLFKAERVAAAGGQVQAAPVAAAPAPPAAADARRSMQLEGGADVRSKPAPAASGAPDDFEAAFAHFSAIKAAKK